MPRPRNPEKCVGKLRPREIFQYKGDETKSGKIPKQPL